MGLSYAAILRVDDDMDDDLLLDTKKLHEQLEEDRKDLSDKLALKFLFSTISAGSRQDTYNQTLVSDKRYNGETSLGHFVDNLKT